MRPAVDSLRLPAELADRVRRHARSAHPAEACGFLLGAVRDRVAHVTTVRAERNGAASDDRYFIEAVDVFRAMQAARRAGDALLGVYHSHPDGIDEPSVRDRDEAWGEWLHLIVACGGDGAAAMRCWIEADGGWTAVPIVGARS